MKTRFNSFDLVSSVTELQKHVGLRVNQVYDIDNKTYLIRLQKTEEKVIILLESGVRIHSTDYEWPKNPAPSGFSMKLRKHLKNKRLEKISQLGVDRIVQLQFGSGLAAHHVFLELFDRGNIMLTDHELTILYVLRPHVQGDRYVFAVREKYPVSRARDEIPLPTTEELTRLLQDAKPGENLRKILTPFLDFGPPLVDHVLLGAGLSGSFKVGKEAVVGAVEEKLIDAFKEAKALMLQASQQPSQGFIIQKFEKRPTTDGNEEELRVNVEFHPLLFRQHETSLYQASESFDKCVDIFFSSMESQKIDLKAIQQERDALKKLENVRRDHNQRLQQLEMTKESDKVKAELITKNRELVDQAIIGVRTMVANQTVWPEIQAMVTDAAAQGDPIASCIKHLKLEVNHIVLQLTDPYSDDSSEEENAKSVGKSKKPILVEVDLDLTAFANARKYYDQKRVASKKQQKTMESQGKAIKSAEKKTKKSLQEMKSIVNITKARKVFWFEKFFWFISSENYLVIAGRDAVQNELVVKRYMRPGDVYVHADVHGASSVIIKNPSKEPVPPKTLNEAGIMAICYSVAWEAKVITNAWWVNSDQVLKSAPSGEYLATGSFSIRGKKNYLPSSNLILGFSFLFKLEESSVVRHAEERCVRSLEEESSIADASESAGDDVEIVLSDGDDDEGDKEDIPVKNESEGLDKSAVENDEALSDNGSSKSQDSQSSDSDEAETAFPDTEIKLLHTGKEISLETKPLKTDEIKDNDENSVVFLGDAQPVVLKSHSGPRKPNKQKQQKKIVKFEPSPPKEDKPKEDSKLKRGQRYKLKKIKEKYKDQDEEDQRLRMEFLAASAERKKNSKKEKKKELAKQAALQKSKPRVPVQPKIKERQGSGDEEEEETVEPAVNDDVAGISSLTGIPHPDDELLFAMPVVAPYTTLQNYKFKVKITPGTGKRGKAARTALSIFLKDKSASQRERDLLKGVKDEELARNLPGKVKVSAPQLYKK